MEDEDAFPPTEALVSNVYNQPKIDLPFKKSDYTCNEAKFSDILMFEQRLSSNLSRLNKAKCEAMMYGGSARIVFQDKA